MSARHLDEQSHKRVVGIRNTFLAGLLVVVPISLTLFLTLWIFDVLTRAIPELFAQFPSRLIQDLLNNQFFALAILMVVLLVILTAIYVVGLVTRNVLGRKVLAFMERLVLKLPMIRTVYSTIQQLGYAILRGGGTGMFRQVALVEYPRRGQFVIGFITAPAPEECNRLTGERMTSIFIPTTPNPTSGFLLFVPQKEIQILPISVLEGMRLVISGGVVKPEALSEPGEPKPQPPPTLPGTEIPAKTQMTGKTAEQPPRPQPK
jgi:uncharacterized membrane protein